MTKIMAEVILKRLLEQDPQKKTFYHGSQNADKVRDAKTLEVLEYTD